MKCPSCQTSNAEGARQCRSCGHSFESGLPTGVLLASRYEIRHPLGTGGMGTVYKAYDRVLEETIALKVLRPEIARDVEMAWRFQAEVRLARKVTHRNVCRMYDYGQDGDLHFISMEFISGNDLSKVVRAQGGLMPDGAFDVALEIAAGLGAIHEVGIVHRDLKAANIMLDSRAVVRIMDFGISKESGSRVTGTGMIIGTPEYMSPEQARGDRITFPSDVYALGIVVFEIFTGQVPFQGENSMATLYKQVHEPPPLQGMAAAAIPPSLIPVLRTALAKDPGLRYPTVRAFAEALQQARGHAQASFFLPTPGLGSPVPSAPPPAPVKAKEAGPKVSPLLTAMEKFTQLQQEGPGLTRLLEAVLGTAQSLGAAEAGRVVLVDIEPTGAGLIEACVGDGADRLRGTHVAAGEGLLSRVAIRGKTLRSGDPAREEGYAPRVDEMAVSKPGFLALPLVSGALRGALLLAGREGTFGPREEADIARFAQFAAIALENALLRERALDSFTHTTELLVSFLERADPGLPRHARSVAASADLITSGLGRPAEEQLHIHFAALLHDIGKLGLDSALLRTEGELSEDQRRQIQQHVALGVQLISPISPWKELPRIIEAHHERFDGTGYPRGLKGNEIPFGARVVAVADAFDAMTVKGGGRTPEEVLAELQAAAFTQFDPVVVRVLEGEYRRRAALFKP